MMFSVSRLEGFIQFVGCKMISYPQWHNFCDYFWNERQVRHRPVVFKNFGIERFFFKSGVTRADLNHNGKTADSNDKLTIRVMKGASRWRCFFKIQIGIGSEPQGLGGESAPGVTPKRNHTRWIRNFCKIGKAKKLIGWAKYVYVYM